MTGQHIERLRKAVAPMNDEDVRESRRAWRDGASSLGEIRTALVTARPGIQRGFGEGSDITDTALKAIDGMIEKVTARKSDMDSAVGALRVVRTAMDAARGVATSQENTTDPGDPPRFPSNVGSDEADEIQAIKQHAAQTRAYNTRVAAFNADDAAAQKALQDLNDAYDEVIPVFAKIHGEPVEPPGGNTPGPGPGGVPGGVRPPIYTPPPGGLIGIDDDPRDPDIDIDIDDDDPRDPDIDIDIDDPRDPDLPDIGNPGGPDIGSPGNPGAGGPGGIHPGLLGGGLLAGGLAAPGAINGIRGLLSRGGVSSGAQAIGSSTRAGGPGALGRSGALAPGSPVGRGAGGRGAGARGAGGRGVPGAQGARGGRGGRGTVGAAGGRGGRRKDGEREGADRELYDDGQDWLDDEGTAPGVLG